MVYPSISSLLLESVTHALSVVNSCFHPLPFKFSHCFGLRERIVEGESLDEQKDMKRKSRGGAVMRDSPPFRSDSVDSLWPASTRTEYIPLIIPFPLSFGSRRKGLTYFNDTEWGLRDEKSTLRCFPVFSCGVRPEQSRKIQNKQRCPQTEIHTSRVGLPPTCK